MFSHIEIPASLGAKLSSEQLDRLQAYANAKDAHHSRKHLAAMERYLSQGKSFDEAHSQAQREVGE